MKKQYKKFVVNSLVVALTASMLVACGSDNSRDPFTENTDNNSNVNPPPTPVKKSTLVSNIVDEDGKPLVGATVSVANQKQQTNTMGKSKLTLKNNSNNKVVLLIKKAGYLTTAKEVMIKEAKTTEIAVKLFKDQVSTSFDASAGSKVENPEKTAKVDIPANAIVDASGNAYKGQVNLAMSYYSPEEMTGIQAFAQPYVGMQENNAGNTGLISVGVIEVKLTDQNGEPLQLNNSSQATITFPANSVSNGLDSIPLWHYDEDKKIWVEDGAATKQADGSYQGQVNHFTLWNLDIPVGKDKGLLKGCFEDEQGNKLTNIHARISGTGWSNYGSTSDGIFEVYVPANLPLTLYPNIGKKGLALPIPALAKNEVRDNTNKCYVVEKVENEDGLSYTLDIEVPPVARDNYKFALQGQGITGNVISDIDGIDTDANGDSLTVVSYRVDTNGDGNPETLTQDQQTTINNVGQFSIKSDGSYQFMPVGDYHGKVPNITYTITDGKQGFAEAELSLEINKPNNEAVEGTHILGYRVAPLIDPTKLNSTDPLSMIQDLVTMTIYIEDGKFNYKYETLKGTAIPQYFTEEYNSVSYTLTDKALSKDKYTFSNNVYTSLSGIVTKIDANSYQGYWVDDKESKTKIDLSKQSIANKNIQFMMNIDADDFKKIYNAIEQLPENERVFTNGEQCTYVSGTTNSKPYIDFSVENPAAGSDTMDDLTNQAKGLTNPISGTWLGIPWIASADVDEEGSSDVFVLYNGRVINSPSGYDQSGTFTSNFDECDWYSKSQIDFTIKAMKKTFPQLR